MLNSKDLESFNKIILNTNKNSDIIESNVDTNSEGKTMPQKENIFHKASIGLNSTDRMVFCPATETFVWFHKPVEKQSDVKEVLSKDELEAKYNIFVKFVR